jgi:hypothetical protein
VRQPKKRSAAAIYRMESVPAIGYSLKMSKKIDSAGTVVDRGEARNVASRPHKGAPYPIERQMLAVYHQCAEGDKAELTRAVT